MRLLAIETSCDETSAAVVANGHALSMVVSSQIETHAEYGGVVPELATREHLKNLQPVVQQALSEADTSHDQLDAIAATRGPGLPPALMIGWKAAQAMAYSLDRSLIGVNHLQAHLYSPWFVGDPPQSRWEKFEPNISLIVSGGHTLINYPIRDSSIEVLIRNGKAAIKTDDGWQVADAEATLTERAASVSAAAQWVGRIGAGAAGVGRQPWCFTNGGGRAWCFTNGA